VRIGNEKEITMANTKIKVEKQEIVDRFIKLSTEDQEKLIATLYDIYKWNTNVRYGLLSTCNKCDTSIDQITSRLQKRTHPIVIYQDTQVKITDTMKYIIFNNEIHTLATFTYRVLPTNYLHLHEKRKL
jgi:hypothetical protein